MVSVFRALAAAPLALAACAGRDMPVAQVVQPYRMIIQQGNFISQEMVAQLKPGMTKEQVRFVLGTPLVTDIFHSDRWDYVYYREPAAGAREQRNLSVIFEGGKLTRVIGDLLPSEAPRAPAKPAAAVAKPAVEKPKPEATGASPPADTPKPAAVGASPPADTPKPAAEPAAAEARKQPAAQPSSQNWGTASEARTAPEPPRPAAAKVDEHKIEPAPEQKTERGFFGRMLEKMLPSEAPSAPAKPAAAISKPAMEKPKPEATSASLPADTPKPAAADTSTPADTPKPAAKPTAAAAPKQPAAQPPSQNSGTASEARPAPEPPRPAAATAKAEEQKPEPVPEQKSERGLFGRMLEKIGF